MTYTRVNGRFFVSAGYSHTYHVLKTRSGWRLAIYDLAGARVSDWPHRSRRRAMATVAAYEALGDDFKPVDYDDSSRTVVAMERAYSSRPPARWIF